MQRFLIIYFEKAQHVSGGSSAHHQEHMTVHSASGIVNLYWCRPVAYPGILFGGEADVQQIQLRTENRENGDLGAVAS